MPSPRVVPADVPIPAPRVWARHCQSPPQQHPPALAGDGEFIGLLGAYRGSGGVARMSELAARTALCAAARPARPPDPVRGEALGWYWQGQLWLPLCQFMPDDLALKAVVAQVLDELLPVMDGLGLARWFVQPHAALGECRPVALMDHDAAAVQGAARMDRFVLSG